MGTCVHSLMEHLLGFTVSTSLGRQQRSVQRCPSEVHTGTGRGGRQYSYRFGSGVRKKLGCKYDFESQVYLKLWMRPATEQMQKSPKLEFRA